MTLLKAGRVVLVATCALGLSGLAAINSLSEAGSAGVPTILLLQGGINAKAMEEGLNIRLAGDLAAAGSPDPRNISPATLELAKATFRADPLSVASQRTLALGLLRDDADTESALALVSRVSKRDPSTNLWLAQKASERDDLAQALQYLSRSLRVSRGAQDQIVPGLVGLLTNDKSHQFIGELLEQGPEWEQKFWFWLARSDAALPQVGQFFRTTGLSPARLKPVDREILYTRLRDAGQFDTLYELATLPGSGVGKSAAFSEAESVGPLGWRLVSTGRYTASAVEDESQLSANTTSGAYGSLGERLTLVDGNALVLSSPRPVGRDIVIRLSAKCAQTDTLLAKVELRQGEKFARTPLVGHDCRFAVMELSFDAADSKSDETVVLDQAGIVSTAE